MAHLVVPFRFGGPSVEQDSRAEIEQCVYVILSYRQGQRLDLPEFGIDDLAFTEGGIDLDRLHEEVAVWEPRARLLTLQEIAELIARVRIDVATGS